MSHFTITSSFLLFIFKHFFGQTYSQSSKNNVNKSLFVHKKKTETFTRNESLLLSKNFRKWEGKKRKKSNTANNKTKLTLISWGERKTVLINSTLPSFCGNFVTEAFVLHWNWEGFIRDTAKLKMNLNNFWVIPGRKENH
jgi:hypothetical protein